MDAGVPEPDIAVRVSPVFGGFYGPAGPGIARLDLTLRDADLARINALIDAATLGAAEERLTVGQVGTLYEVADCAPLERQAREAAIADAHTRAEVQAELLGVQLGAVVASRDVPIDAAALALGPYGPVFAASAGCAPLPASGFYGGAITLAPFDPTAPTEVEVSAQVRLTFAFEGSDAVVAIPNPA